MKIDLTCPVELWHCKMPTAQEPVLAMQVYNLSDKAVSSIQVCVLCFDAAGEQFARRVERALSRVAVKYQPSLGDILEADRLGREAAR